MQQALVEWGEQALYVALDTSMLWNTYCLIRLSVIYRGRAVPLVWCVLEHGSAQVGFETYREPLDRAAVLLPRRCKVIFLPIGLCRYGPDGPSRPPWLALADTDQEQLWLSRRGCRRCKVERLAVARGRRVSGTRSPSRQALWASVSGRGAPGKARTLGMSSVTNQRI